MPTSHLAKQRLFILLSLADLVLTWWLLVRSGDVVAEGNPIAAWSLHCFGWLGLIAFKVGIILVVLGLVKIIHGSRPRVGGRVLDFGCVVLAGVVLYSLSLCPATLQASEARLADVLQETRAYQDRLNQANARESQARIAFWCLFERLAGGVADEEYRLDEAAGLLMATEYMQNATWLQALATVSPGRPPRECLAARLVLHLILVRDHESRAQARQLAVRLVTELENTYGQPAPDRLVREINALPAE
jgi:hypothetical protein